MLLQFLDYLSSIHHTIYTVTVESWGQIVMPEFLANGDGTFRIECPAYSEWYDTFDRGAFCKAI